MATSNSSTGHEWNDLPLFAEGIPVSLSVQQVIAKVKKILATCGLGYDKPLANYDPITQSWKMSAGIFPLGEQPSLPTLPPSGMTRNGALFQQPAWEPITGETASLSWPTPRANNAMASTITPEIAHDPKRFPNLETVVGRRMWPTPTTQETEHPNAQLTKTGRRLSKDGNSSHSVGLADAVRMWPTPTARDGKGAANYKSSKRNEADLTNQARSADGAQRGSLNPTWVEWLMGFPTGWTDLEA